MTRRKGQGSPRNDEDAKRDGSPRNKTRHNKKIASVCS